VEAETKTVRQVGADLLRLQERVEGEKAARETELGQLRTEIHEVLGNRNVADEKFQVGGWVGGGGAGVGWLAQLGPPSGLSAVCALRVCVCVRIACP